MNPKIILNQADFDNLIIKLRQEDYICLDTEFERRRTYFANLSIIQINCKAGLYIIDVLAINDLSAFQEILNNESILKILHAAEQDFEIFYHLFNKMPQNFFDTQIAASFCGFSKRISYADLCNAICNVSLDKTLQKTNWMVRPISEVMIDYLSSDVKYLKAIYDYLHNELNRRDKIGEYHINLSSELKEDNYKINSENEWQRIKIPKYFSSIEIEIIKNLASFRNDLAIQKNVPRKYILSNNDILNISRVKPQNIKDLKKIALESKSAYKENLANKIIDVVLFHSY
jgi:ribonuclease D